MHGTLLQFRVKNHGSIRDSQTLSMVAATAKDESGSLLSVPHRDVRVGRVAAIYGANASGKTMLLDAFALMRSAVVLSQRVWSPERPLPVNIFALAEPPTAVTELGVTVFLGGVRHDYDITLSADRVEREELHVWPAHRKQLRFRRVADVFKFGKSLSGDNQSIRKLVRKNSLFLSAAAQNNHAQLSPLYAWFARAVMRSAVLPTRANIGGADLETNSGDNVVTYQNEIAGLLRTADTGIVDLKIEELPAATSEGAPTDRRRFKFNMKHRGTAPKWLPFNRQSSGTIAMFDLALHFAPLLAQGGVAFVDELERGLHPALALDLLKLFQDPKRNPNGAQLIFTTHDVTLLGNTVEPTPLRRDQIWFAEKNKDGATAFYPLTDFHPRINESLERGYLQGRYGAIPYFKGLRFDDGKKI